MQILSRHFKSKAKFKIYIYIHIYIYIYKDHENYSNPVSSEVTFITRSGFSSEFTSQIQMSHISSSFRKRRRRRRSVGHNVGTTLGPPSTALPSRPRKSLCLTKWSGQIIWTCHQFPLHLSCFSILNITAFCCLLLPSLGWCTHLLHVKLIQFL